MPRPRITYSDGIADQLIDALARGRTLKDICRAPGMPNKSRVFEWVTRNRHGFGDRYRRVRHVRGRGSCYSLALSMQICAELSAGRSLLDICHDEGMPSVRVVRQWVMDDRDGFRARYWQARGIGYLALADAIIEIADNPVGESVGRSRLLITARCWMLSKMLPRAFGAEATPEMDASLRRVIALINGEPHQGPPTPDPAPSGGHCRCLHRPNVDGYPDWSRFIAECETQGSTAKIWPVRTCRKTCIGPEIDCNLVP